jgi:hypothetical protein
MCVVSWWVHNSAWDFSAPSKSTEVYEPLFANRVSDFVTRVRPSSSPSALPYGHAPHNAHEVAHSHIPGNQLPFGRRANDPKRKLNRPLYELHHVVI